MEAQHAQPVLIQKHLYVHVIRCFGLHLLPMMNLEIATKILLAHSGVS